MMSFKKKINRWVKRKQADIERGREITMQMKAERARKKNKRIDEMQPGAVKAIAEGLRSKSSPLDVMKQEYYRRKYEREKKSD